MKRFLLFSAQYLPHIGGVELYTKNLAEALVAKGHQVTVVTCQGEKKNRAQVTNITDNGVRALYLPSRPYLNGRYPVPLKNNAYQSAFASLREEGFDCVVVNTRFYPSSIDAAKFAREAGITPIVIDHGSAHLTMGNALVDCGVQAVEHSFTRSIKKYNPAFYGVSTASVAWLKHFDIEAKGVLHNSIDADAYVAASSGRNFRNELAIDENDHVFCFIGRLIPEKGLRPLLEYLKSGRTPDHAKFIIAGNGPMQQEVESACSADIFYVGTLNSPDVAALLLTSDAMILPTRSEGFSTSLLEAAACRALPIITNVGGVQELFGEEYMEDTLHKAAPSEIERMVSDVLSRTGYYAAMKNILHQRVKDQFCWEDTANRVIAACEAAQV